MQTLFDAKEEELERNSMVSATLLKENLRGHGNNIVSYQCLKGHFGYFGVYCL